MCVYRHLGRHNGIVEWFEMTDAGIERSFMEKASIRVCDKILRISDALVPINLFTQHPGNFVTRLAGEATGPE
jgi:hypothetical protein